MGAAVIGYAIALNSLALGEHMPPIGFCREFLNNMLLFLYMNGIHVALLVSVVLTLETKPNGSFPIETACW